LQVSYWMETSLLQETIYVGNAMKDEGLTKNVNDEKEDDVDFMTDK
jgi:hypothetical protein